METLTQEEQALLDEALKENDTRNIIPVNSRTISQNIATSRFSSAEWYAKAREQYVVLAGIGGIGGYVGFLLARLGILQIIMYDPDTVGEENMSGQLYGRGDIGNYKVTALSTFLREYADMSNTSLIAVNEPYESNSPTKNIMICGFDNMEARKTFFKAWKLHTMSKTDETKAKCLFLDGRLSAEEFQIFCIKGNDEKAIEVYEKEWLFDDREAEETVCSYKQTTFCANMIASYMVNCFVNFIANQCGLIIDRDVPFKIYYDAKNMIFKVIEPWQL